MKDGIASVIPLGYILLYLCYRATNVTSLPWDPGVFTWSAFESGLLLSTAVSWIVPWLHDLKLHRQKKVGVHANCLDLMVLLSHAPGYQVSAVVGIAMLVACQENFVNSFLKLCQIWAVLHWWSHTEAIYVWMITMMMMIRMYAMFIVRYALSWKVLCKTPFPG